MQLSDGYTLTVQIHFIFRVV